MRISVIGTGYVGLVSGTGFAEMGNTVVCVDIDQTKIDNLKKSILPIYEPGLQELVSRNVGSERLHFTTDIKSAVEDSDVIFIAVGTPSDEDGRADLKYVLQVADSIGQHMNEYKVIVNKSTVPVGTGYDVKKQISQALTKRGVDHQFDIVSNPEFLKEGAAISDFLKPDRIVVGVESDRARKVMEKVYSPFVLRGDRVIYMDIKSSEMTKYASNAMLATRISFMNELARLCDKLDVDILNVRKGMGSDPRIGSSFLYPGVGYGGSCFPKDVSALITTGKENDQDLALLSSVVAVNDSQPKWFMTKVYDHFNNDLKGKTIAVWGLAFKPGTDDMRKAPSIDVITSLLNSGAKVSAYDPIATETAQQVLPNSDDLTYFKNAYDVLTNADALILCTEWPEFREPDFDDIKSRMKKTVIFDGRNQFRPSEMNEYGFTYYSVGRP